MHRIASFLPTDFVLPTPSVTCRLWRDLSRDDSNKLWSPWRLALLRASDDLSGSGEEPCAGCDSAPPTETGTEGIGTVLANKFWDVPCASLGGDTSDSTSGYNHSSATSNPAATSVVASEQSESCGASLRPANETSTVATSSDTAAGRSHFAPASSTEEETCSTSHSCKPAAAGSLHGNAAGAVGGHKHYTTFGRIARLRPELLLGYKTNRIWACEALSWASPSANMALSSGSMPVLGDAAVACRPRSPAAARFSGRSVVPMTVQEVVRWLRHSEAPAQAGSRALRSLRRR